VRIRQPGIQNRMIGGSQPSSPAGTRCDVNQGKTIELRFGKPRVRREGVVLGAPAGISPPRLDHLGMKEAPLRADSYDLRLEFRRAEGDAKIHLRCRRSYPVDEYVGNRLVLGEAIERPVGAVDVRGRGLVQEVGSARVVDHEVVGNPGARIVVVRPGDRVIQGAADLRLVNATGAKKPPQGFLVHNGSLPDDAVERRRQCCEPLAETTEGLHRAQQTLRLLYIGARETERGSVEGARGFLGRQG
jgi:hypothetical protein